MFQRILLNTLMDSERFKEGVVVVVLSINEGGMLIEQQMKRGKRDVNKFNLLSYFNL